MEHRDRFTKARATMRISTNSCLCPFLFCLCFIQRCYGASHHVPAKVPSKNQTKMANGETEVHHRPKRGWIWNQFFVLEEHMGPDAQYVGKVGVFTYLFIFPAAYFAFFPPSLFTEKWVTAGAGCSIEGGVLCRQCTCSYCPLMCKSRSHL